MCEVMAVLLIDTLLVGGVRQHLSLDGREGGLTDSPHAPLILPHTIDPFWSVLERNLQEE